MLVDRKEHAATPSDVPIRVVLISTAVSDRLRGRLATAAVDDKRGPELTADQLLDHIAFIFPAMFHGKDEGPAVND